MPLLWEEFPGPRCPSSSVLGPRTGGEAVPGAQLRLLFCSRSSWQHRLPPEATEGGRIWQGPGPGHGKPGKSSRASKAKKQLQLCSSSWRSLPWGQGASCH